MKSVEENMAGIEKFYDNGQSSSAAQKRAVQLKDWENSATNKQPSTVVASRLKPTIKFADSVVFLAAAHSGDTVEVEKLVLNEGADVNSVNKDGLTALHQVLFFFLGRSCPRLNFETIPFISVCFSGNASVTNKDLCCF